MFKTVFTKNGTIVEDPPIARFLFSDTRIMGWVWAVIRILVGLQWVQAAEHKLTSDAWMVTGSALQGYWQKAVAIPAQGSAPITYDWYRSFIQSLLDSGSYVWFAKLVAVGELAVGIALIIGAFVGIAAFFGALMNWNYLLAGSTSSNPILGLAAIALILAWKIAGYYGADYFLLRKLGTPWGKKTTQEVPVSKDVKAPSGAVGD